MEDLFGNTVIKDVLLRDTFIEPPFSVLDTKNKNWKDRKTEWLKKGIKSEVGRNSKVINAGTDDYRKQGENNRENYVSIFDPVLCELMYHWFCPDGGSILDPFAGGSVRGIVANHLGYKYTGIDLRQEQIDSNIEQGREILSESNQPVWLCGDSNWVLDTLNSKYDFIFTCPPYVDLEVYSTLDGDLSNMTYTQFCKAYDSIIRKSCLMLKQGGYACFVVGEVRDKNGFFVGLVPDTIHYFRKYGMKYYNEAVLLNPVASASMRASKNMVSKKLVKIHQNVLVFKKV